MMELNGGEGRLQIGNLATANSPLPPNYFKPLV